MRILSFVGACALMLGVPALVSAQGQKFAYVNSAAILQSAPGRAEAEALFDKDMTSMRAAVRSSSRSIPTHASNPMPVWQHPARRRVTPMTS